MFEKFYELVVYEKQQAYLQRFIHPQLIKRRRHGNYEHPGESRRQHTFHYFLMLPGGSEVRVCLKTFCDTFGITARRVQLLSEKILSGTMDHTEKRGGARTARNINEWREKIIAHISSFPSEISHYSRHQSESRYLSPDLNVTKMYRAFLEKHCQNYVRPPVSRQWYHQIFLTHFNLRFRVPRVDTCSTCDNLNMRVKNSTDVANKREAETALQLHHRRHECATKAMQYDSKNAKQSNSYVLAFDMQQQVYVPQLTHAEMYYSRQMACCNLGIHDSEIDNGFMCFWPETVGGRGSIEVAHCVYTYLTSQINTNKEKLIVWSDNCGAQNKNQIMLAMYLTLLAKGYFSEIIHKFPVKGHTFLACDRDFGVIEKKKKRSQAIVPMDVVRIIASAKVKNPFTVMVFNGFHDWKSVAHTMLNTSKLKISDVACMKLKRDQFGAVEIWKTHGSLQSSQKIQILKAGKSVEDFANISIEEKRTRDGIPADKVQHIKAMIPYLETKAQEYYANVCGVKLSSISEKKLTQTM